MTVSELLTTEQLAEIAARANAATRGPWRISDGQYASPWEKRLPEGSTAIVSFGTPFAVGFAVAAVPPPHFSLQDAEFVAAARDDIPALLAHVAALQAEIDWLKRLHEDEERDTV